MIREPYTGPSPPLQVRDVTSREGLTDLYKRVRTHSMPCEAFCAHSICGGGRGLEGPTEKLRRLPAGLLPPLPGLGAER